MAAVTEGEVLSALKQCYDPEIPVNIVDLGLIYAVRFEAVAGRPSRCLGRPDAYLSGLPVTCHDRRTSESPPGAVAGYPDRNRERGVDSAVDPRASKPRGSDAVGY